MDENLMSRAIGRRRLIRRAGTVAAGVAGAGAVGAVLANPAEAAQGDNVIIGAANTGGTSSTALTTNSISSGTLELTNTATALQSGANVAGPSLRLVPGGDFVGGPSGSVGMSTDGTLWTVRPGTGGPFSDPVRTFGNSTKVESFAPVRMLDTRPGAPASTHTGILNPGVIDGQGYIIGGQSVHLNLDGLLVFGWTAFLNITLIPRGALGFITLYPTGAPLPNASNITFAGNERFIANAAVVAIGAVANVSVNAISVYATAPCQVILDVSAAVVNYSSDVLDGQGNPTLQAKAAPTTRVRPAHLRPPAGR